MHKCRNRLNVVWYAVTEPAGRATKALTTCDG